MVEISSSGSGEGPGRVTSRPTLQATFSPRRCHRRIGQTKGIFVPVGAYPQRLQHPGCRHAVPGVCA
jgi:hypothetical protein